MHKTLIAAGVALACFTTVNTAAQPAVANGMSFAAANTQSADWAGWDVTGGTYTSVSATWAEPKVTCSTASQSSSAFWVGLDGDTSTSVEQTGTEANCVDGVAQYNAWYEFYPAPSVNLPEVVNAGDVMTGSVTYSRGSGTYVLTIKDVTRRWTYTKRGTVEAGTNASAEVIAEAPTDSQTGSVVSLADFGTVTFKDVKVNGQAIGTVATAKPITMAAASESLDGTAQSTVLATASALTNDNRFSVAFKSSGSSEQASTSGGNDPYGQAGGGWPYPPGATTGGYGQDGGGYDQDSGGYGLGGYGSGGYGSGGYGAY